MKKAYYTNNGLANVLDPTQLDKYGVRAQDNDYVVFELFDFKGCESIFNEAVEKDRIESGQKMSNAGRRAFAPLMMGMIFAIKTFRNWSDERTYKEIAGNLCLRAFLRLGEGSAIPKPPTIWKYSQIFTNQNVFQKLFGMTVQEAKLLNPEFAHSVLGFDSTYVLSPIQRNDKLTWDEIKAGRGEELWKDHPQKKITRTSRRLFRRKIPSSFSATRRT